MSLGDHDDTFADVFNLPDLDIVISGVSGRFPKANSVNEYEANYRNGTDMVTHDDSSRFPLGLWNLPKSYGRLKCLDQFDNDFFGLTDDQSNHVNYQYRVCLEVLYECLLDAGLNPSQLRGCKRTGLYMGMYTDEFGRAVNYDVDFDLDPTFYDGLAASLARYFSIQGPTMTMDAACAASFVALDEAINAIQLGLIDRALVVGCNIPLDPRLLVAFHLHKMVSPTGTSKFLDAKADGYAKSETIVAILIERKALARRCYASILASSKACDGFNPEGITYPSQQAQQDLIASVKLDAKLKSDQVEYYEMHGTGTPVGDPIELGAVTGVYNPKHHQLEPRTVGPLVVGSSKAYIGHTEAASGLCALVKCVMMLEHELIYESIHFDTPNTRAEALHDGRAVVRIAEPRKLRSKVIPINCFGFGGSNVHVILRANPTAAIRQDDPNDVMAPLPRLVVMFGRGQAQLEHFFDQLLDHQSYQTRNCLTNDFLQLVDSINSAEIDPMMTHRGYVIVDKYENGFMDANGDNRAKYRQLSRVIKACKLQQVDSAANEDERQDYRRAKQRECCIIFPGLGSDWPQMALGLQSFEPFWSTIQRLDGILDNWGANANLTELLTANANENQALATVAYEIALFNMLNDERLKLGEQITTVAGHSVGELSCLYASGLLNEEQTILAAYAVGKTLHDNIDSISGEMVAVMMSDEQASEFIYSNELRSCPTLRVSCINGPGLVTMSGSHVHMKKLYAQLERARQSYVMVESRVALHNDAIMGYEIRHKLTVALQQVFLNETNWHVLLKPCILDRDAKLTWIRSSKQSSSVDHESITQSGKTLTIIEYLVESLCLQVDFLHSLRQFEANSIVCEVGPCGLFGSQVLMMNSATTTSCDQLSYIAMIDKATSVGAQRVKLLESIGELYLAGAKLNIEVLNGRILRGENCNDKQGDHPEGISRVLARKQTPSLSSMVQWKHEKSFLVPTYPNYFSNQPCGFRIDLGKSDINNEFLFDHIIDGRPMLAATGFVFYAWKLYSHLGGKKNVQYELAMNSSSGFKPCEIRDLSIRSPVYLDATNNTFMDLTLDNSSGKFQFMCDDQVVCDGLISNINQQNANEDFVTKLADMNRSCHHHQAIVGKRDIYRQFRIRGYDYGEKFQLIDSTSRNRDHSRVRYANHFISFADCVLQSSKMHVSQFAKTAGDYELFVPTRIDYVRIIPQLMRAKLLPFKLDIDAKSAEAQGHEDLYRDYMNEISADKTNKVIDNAEQDVECLFDVYSDSDTNVVMTDGLEIRGLHVTSMPRQLRDPIFQWEKFVHDDEQPVDEPHLVDDMRVKLGKYTQVCNSIALDLIMDYYDSDAQVVSAIVEHLVDDGCQEGEFLSRVECEKYMVLNLHERIGDIMTKKGKQLANIHSNSVDNDHSVQRQTSDDYGFDIDKNNGMNLLSILDCIQVISTKQRLINGLRGDLMQDILSYHSEYLHQDMTRNLTSQDRIWRPTFDVIFENLIDFDNGSIKSLEVNYGYNLMAEQVFDMNKRYRRHAQLQWSIAHPDPVEQVRDFAIRRKFSAQLANIVQLDDLATDNDTRSCRLKRTNNQAGQSYDLICYVDSSCCDLSYKSHDISDLIVDLRVGGFLIVKLKSRWSFGEKFALCFSDQNPPKSVSELICKLKSLDQQLTDRCEQIERQASRMLHCVTKKSECDNIVLVYRKIGLDLCDREQYVSMLRDKLLVARVTNDNMASWMDQVRLNLRAIIETSNRDESRRQPTKVVWLCAIATKQANINGLIGMFRTLTKEYGRKHLRCYHDEWTFRHRDEQLDGSVSDEEIVECAKFRESVHSDLLWNCFDSSGKRGAFRHIMVNEQLQYPGCLTDRQPIEYERLDCDHNQRKAYYADLSVKRDLSSFKWLELPFKYLDEREKRHLVLVCYSAINFRDVMLATGKVRGEIMAKSRIMDTQLGLEYSGVELATGRRVFGVVAGGAIATHILALDGSATQFEVPDYLDMREAATIPAVYSTLVMGLIIRAKMRRGESILIHAGSGALGQAAIHLCSHHGLTIYTTVGTEEKRDFLLQEFGDCLDDSRIFGSRDCKFEQQVMAATRGKGVDLVLNSLADDKLQASIRCLADGGRFVEVGKYDLAMNSKLELEFMNTNKSFHGIALDLSLHASDDNRKRGSYLASQSEQFEQIFNSLLRQRVLKPIKHTVFARNRIESAFRFMAQAKHIGKVLVEINPLEFALGRQVPKLMAEPRMHFSPQKSYIVTGGLGAMGVELCKWLALRGVRNLLVTSRAGFANEYQRCSFESIEGERKCKTLVVTKQMADTETREGCQQLCQLALGMSPSHQIGGIFHLAAVLSDGIFDSLSVEDFRVVFGPKLNTGIYLDSVCEQMQLRLDYFVCYSSMSSAFGNVGQTNYSYANSALERICEQRRARGQHATAIQWGLVGDAGLGYEVYDDKRLQVIGVLPQRLASCMQEFPKLVASPFAVISCALPKDLSVESSVDIKSRVLKILGIQDTSRLDEQATLGSLGVDSLMGVEIMQLIERDKAKRIPPNDLRNMKLGHLNDLDNAIADDSS